MKTIKWGSVGKGSEKPVFAGFEDVVRLQKGLAQDFNTQRRETCKNWGQSIADFPCFYGDRSLKASLILAIAACWQRSAHYCIVGYLAPLVPMFIKHLSGQVGTI